MGQRGRPGVFSQGPAVRGGKRIGEQRLGERARDTLAAAHEAWAGGRWAEAGAGFAKGVRICRDRGMHRSAAWLGTLEAAAHAKGGDARAALGAVEGALADARADGDRSHAASVFGELLAALAGTPLEASVPDLERAIREAVGVAPRARDQELNRSDKRTLPGRCDVCGVAPDPEKVRPSDDGSDCQLCGSVL